MAGAQVAWTSTVRWRGVEAHVEERSVRRQRGGGRRGVEEHAEGSGRRGTGVEAVDTASRQM
jgi:hypothetical protein